jgi:tetratricopeptide (TPR) repeat protein
MGRFDEAIEQMGRARELDPLYPRIHVQSAQPLYMSGDFDSAQAMLESARAKFPESGLGNTVSARMFLSMGDYDRALEAAMRAEPTFKDGLMGMALGLLGRSEEARATSQRLDERSHTGYASPIDFALVHIGLGEEEQALDWLERGYDERALLMVFLKTWPLYDPLRDEPRFEELLSKMNFPD